MSYPAEWRPFFVKHMLPFEGGFQPSNNSIFGILKENWADLIMKIPPQEFSKIPQPLKGQLEDIREAPPSERLGKTVEWIHDVARHTHAWGNKTQPKDGKPFRSEEYASSTGNAAYLSSVHELAFGIFYRDYIDGVGLTGLPVQHRIQETVSDISVRYGTAHSYALLVKAMEDSGVISSRQMNEWGWVKSADLPDAATYQPGGAGYRYTLTSTRREIAEALRGISADQQQVLFDYYGKWRRTYDANKDNQSERAGDDKRTYALHGNPSQALARIAVAEASGLAVYGGLSQGQGQAQVQATASKSDLIQLADQGDVALVQALEGGMFTGNWGNDNNVRSIAIQLPDDRGVVRYTVKEELAFVDENDKAVQRTVPMLDTIVGSLPKGVELVREGTTSKDGKYRNPYTDGDVLYWRDAGTKKAQYLPIGGSFNEKALALPTNYNWYNIFSSNDTVTAEVKGKVQFDPQYSARFFFDPADPNLQPGWATPPTGQPQTLQMADVPTTATQLANNAPITTAGDGKGHQR